MCSIKKIVKGSFLMNFFLKYRLFKFRRCWKKKNTHNLTTVNCVFSLETVTVGDNTYGELNVITFRNVTKLIIGSCCSIGQKVYFILDAGHAMNRISTYPFKTALLNVENEEATSKGNIVIEDDVWIGFGSIIMSGVHIGRGAVIAAGSVVTKDVPPYAIVGGNPSKIIRYRFSPEMIDELMKIDYNKLTKAMIKEHINELYVELSDVKQLKWLPQITLF